MNNASTWAAVAVGAIALGSPKGARACSAALCSATVVTIAPAAGTVIPANAPGVVAHGDWGSSFRTFDLVGPDDQVVSTTRVSALPSDVMLALGAPLNAGTMYTVRASSACPDYGRPDAGATTSASASFTAGPPSPLPTSMGTITVRHRMGLAGSSVSYLAPAEVPVAAAELHLDPAPDLAPYLPVVQFSTSVDGMSWSASLYGSSIADGPTTTVRGRSWKTIYASCGRALESSACEVPGVAPGQHVVRVQAHVAGAALDPPSVEVAIDLQCPPSDGGAADDATATAPLDGAITEATSPTGHGNDVPEAAAEAPDGSAAPSAPGTAACAFGRATRESSWGLMLLVAMGALLARARRRGA